MRKDITCFGIKPNYYEADSNGFIYVKSTQRRRKFSKNSCGYNLISLVLANGGQRYFLNHRVILQTFEPIEHPEKFQVNHKRGKENGDAYENLEWCTRSENMRHAYLNNRITIHRGEDNVMSIFSNRIIHKLCRIMEHETDYHKIFKELQDSGYWIVALPGDETKVQGVIYHLRKGTAWRHISCQYNIITPDRYYGFFESKENIEKVCRLLELGHSVNSIALEMFNEDSQRTRDYIHHIKRRITYKDISKNYCW